MSGTSEIRVGGALSPRIDGLRLRVLGVAADPAVVVVDEKTLRALRGGACAVLGVTTLSGRTDLVRPAAHGVGPSPLDAIYEAVRGDAGAQAIGVSLVDLGHRAQLEIADGGGCDELACVRQGPLVSGSPGTENVLVLISETADWSRCGTLDRAHDSDITPSERDKLGL